MQNPVQENGKGTSKRMLTDGQVEISAKRIKSTDGGVVADIYDCEDILSKKGQNELLRQEVDRLKDELSKLKEELASRM